MHLQRRIFVFPKLRLSKTDYCVSSRIAMVVPMRKERNISVTFGIRAVSSIAAIRAAFLCAIIYEVFQIYHASYSADSLHGPRRTDEASTSNYNDVLNTYLEIRNVEIEGISTKNSHNYIDKHQSEETLNKKKHRTIFGPWRKKVAYTTTGVVVEGKHNDMIQQHKESSEKLSLLRKSAPQLSSTGDLIEMSRRHIEPRSKVSVAICFKTLFGSIDLGIVLQWAAYNRLLGFDHIFMWYRPEMVNNSRFNELQSLPYVTLTLNTKGNRKNYYNQWWTEEICNQDDQFAGKYDYALHADIDEYLWFPSKIGVKEFLLQHSELNYMSFGKRMYTLDHSPEIPSSLENHQIDMSMSDDFAVSKYPFYIESFCYHRGLQIRGQAYCPTWRGRAKVIVRPKQYIKIDTHGNIRKPNITGGEMHFLPHEAHFMEWPEIFARHNVTKREPVAFTVQGEDQVHIHNLARGFKSDDNGNFQMLYDGQLKDWFQFVTSRFATDS